MKCPLMVVAIACMWLRPPAVAQDGPPKASVSPEHAALQKFVGEWECRSTCVMGPGGETQQSTGKIKTRMVGDFWAVSDFKYDFSVMSMSGVQMIGYDPKKGSYIATWVDSVMNHRWDYTGTLNEAGDTFVFLAEGPSMTGEGETTYRDTYKFVDANTVEMKSEAKLANGEWFTFVNGTSKNVASKEAE